MSGRNEHERRSAPRRTFLKAAGASSAVAFAGCLTGDEGDDGDAGNAGNGGDSSTTTVGTTESGSGSLTVGVLAPAPGSHPFGFSIAKGAELAIDRINEQGGIAGREVEMSLKDTKGKRSVGQKVYEELLEEDVAFTVGMMTSEVLDETIDDIVDAEKIHMASGAADSSPSIKVSENYDEYKYFFRPASHNDVYFGQVMFDIASDLFVDEMGWEKVALFYEDEIWPQKMMDLLRGEYSGASDLPNVDSGPLSAVSGAEIVDEVAYPIDQSDFTEEFDRLEDEGVDGVIPGFAHTGTEMTAQWAKQDREFGMAGVHIPAEIPGYWDATSGACKYVATVNWGSHNAEITSKNLAFADTFESRYDRLPTFGGYATNDALFFIKEAIEDAGSFDEDDVIPTMEEISMEGTVGTLELNGRGHPFPHDLKYGDDAARPILVQWQETDDGSGKQRVIWPDSHATTSYQPVQR